MTRRNLKGIIKANADATAAAESTEGLPSAKNPGAVHSWAFDISMISADLVYLEPFG